MIFVTVGTHTSGFERLVRAMDEVAGELDEPVAIQCGSTNWKPLHAQWFEFASADHIAYHIARCRVVVAHAAAGTTMQAIAAGKPLVLVPRLRQFREMMDDHQLELAGALDALGRAVSVERPTAALLREAIERAAGRQRPLAGPALLTAAVHRQLGAWQTRSAGR